MTFSDQVMALTWGQIFQMTSSLNFSSCDESQEEKYDAGKINAVSLLSQKVLQKNLKMAIFRDFALWRPNHWS